MSNNLTDNNNKYKDLTSQTHSTEPSINILSKLNSIANENFHQIIPPIVCEICYKADNLIRCEICKNGFHKKCLETVFLPEPFICLHCKKQFTEEEISSIINNPYNQSYLHRKGIMENQNIYKKFEPKKKNTKIIELDEDNENDNDNNTETKKSNDKSIEGKNNFLNGNRVTNKKKKNKEIKDIISIENLAEYNKEDNCTKSENKSIRKDPKNKIKKDPDKNDGGGGGEVGENDAYEGSIISKSQEINLDKITFQNKKRKKDKISNSNPKNKNISNHRSNSPVSTNIKNNSSNNNNDTKPNKEKSIKEELSIHQTQSQSNKKSSKKRNNDSKNEKEQNLLLSLTHTDPQYKRRKIKIGMNRQCNMYEFTDKYENKINFDEEEYERKDLIQVWSVEKNPLSEEELNNYINTARLFWNYRNIHIEEDLCSDFFQECEQKMKNKKIVPKLKNKITKLIKELKELIKRGINLNSHYDEMSLRVLHLCKYKTNIALLFLYKGLNPFIEEVEEGFKHDIYFFQDEIYSFINNGDFFDPDN